MAEIKDKAWLESLCRSFTESSIKTLGGWAVGPETNDDLKMRAIQVLLERGWGRPKQDNTHELKGEIRVTLRKMLKDEGDE